MQQLLNGHIPRALTIAGSDSGGGAGIQADLKTIHQFGVYGMSVITALTAQNTQGVQGIHEVPAAFVRQQLESVYSDIRADAVKTGMLSSEPIIREVASFLDSVHAQQVVVDPVMVAKGGSRLLSEDAVEALQRTLLPLAYMVTPNLPEAEVLCGYPLKDWEACHQAARDIANLGPRVVIIKGGHAPVEWSHEVPGGVDVEDHPVVDIVYHSGEFTYFATPRIETKNTHGTGCTFSAAVTAMLARGAALLEAIAAAKAFVFRAIEGGRNWDVGTGHGPTDHSAPVGSPGAPRPGGFYLYTGIDWMELSKVE